MGRMERAIPLFSIFSRTRRANRRSVIVRSRSSITPPSRLNLPDKNRSGSQETAHGYHARTYGFLVDELVRRITNGTAVGHLFPPDFRRPSGSKALDRRARVDRRGSGSDLCAAQTADTRIRAAILPSPVRRGVPHPESVFDSRRAPFSVADERPGCPPASPSLVGGDRHGRSLGPILSDSLFRRDIFLGNGPPNFVTCSAPARIKFSGSTLRLGSVS